MLVDPKGTPPLEAAPGLTSRTLAPMLEMLFRMADDDPAPITMPKVVSMARRGLRRSALKAVRKVR
jgi:hypothetical protein